MCELRLRSWWYGMVVVALVIVITNGQLSRFVCKLKEETKRPPCTRPTSRQQAQSIFNSEKWSQTSTWGRHGQGRSERDSLFSYFPRNVISPYTDFYSLKIKVMKTGLDFGFLLSRNKQRETLVFFKRQFQTCLGQTQRITNSCYKLQLNVITFCLGLPITQDY